VLLDLKTDGQGVGDDFFREFTTGNRREAGGNFFERLALLFRCERMHPGKQQRTNGIQLVRGDLLLGPLVIFNRADDEFDFVGGFQMRDVLETVARDFAAGGTFQIHDAADARVNF